MVSHSLDFFGLAGSPFGQYTQAFAGIDLTQQMQARQAQVNMAGMAGMLPQWTVAHAPAPPRARVDCQGCGAPDEGGYRCRYCRRMRA